MDHRSPLGGLFSGLDASSSQLSGLGPEGEVWAEVPQGPGQLLGGNTACHGAMGSRPSKKQQNLTRNA